jgi:hypothetical protein
MTQNARKMGEFPEKYRTKVEISGKLRKFPEKSHKFTEKSGNLRKNAEISGKIPYISGDSDARESKSREMCEKKGGFHGIQTLESPKVEGLVKKRGFHGIQTLESPKVEGLVKKRGISRDSDTRESESRGICEKTSDPIANYIDTSYIDTTASEFENFLTLTCKQVFGK